MLKDVIIKRIEDNDNPRFVKTQKIIAERDGIEFPWECTKGFESVHVFVLNIDTGEALFVKQVRVPVLANYPKTKGIVVECCAGLVDKDKPYEVIAKEEVLEELGYDVPVEDIQFIRTLKSSVGTSGYNSYCYYVNVTNDMKVSNGGGLHDEDIEVVAIKFNEMIEYIMFNIETDAITSFLVMLAYTNVLQSQFLSMSQNNLN